MSTGKARNPLQQLATYGQSVWYDNLSRQLITSGGLQDLIDNKGVVGITSNPTIFDKAISGSDAYDEQLRHLASDGREADEIFYALAIRDIQTAADVLRPVYDATMSGEIVDGFVSLEVSPVLAHDSDKTMTDARTLFKRVDRPNVMIKIPGTVEGVSAIEETLYEGLNINITLLFSLDAYQQVAEAYLKALERRLAEGKPLDCVHSVASFFVSRVDTEADKRLQRIIDAEPGSERARKAEGLLGTLAVANAKLAYAKFKEMFDSERFRKLASNGARVQRPLWASTSTKNPAYSDTLYVDTLIGPRTVQTLAQASIDAFGDHGVVSGPTVEDDLEQARAVFRGFEELGISYDDITETLVREGVASFAKSFESLLNGLRDKRAAFQQEIDAQRLAQVGGLADATRQALDELQAENAPQRLQQRDTSLWGGDTSQQHSIEQRLGWLPVVDRMLDEARQGYFASYAGEVRERGYQRAVLLGMGGSSLAPDVFSKIFTPAEGFPTLTVLDTTDPDSIARVAKDVRGQRTLFLVSTKSGTTVETLSLYRYFLNERSGDARDFVAITDPGTALETEAREKGFWRVFLNPPDIGGRYSALSYFGLVAAATMGVDVENMLLRAAGLLPVHDVRHPGVWLGAVLGAGQRAGRDKLTLVASERWRPFGDWLEQLIAESTGKQGTGIIPVTGESLGAPGEYGDDRLFVALLDPKDDATRRKLDALRAAGAPVVALEIVAPEDLGDEFVRWEVATAVAGGLLGINPFDEANVQEAKDATNAVLKNPATAPDDWVAPDDAIRELLGAVRPRGYIAITAYVDRTPQTDAAFDKLRNALRERSGLATTLGYGPRYLHSTGQLHKGGPSTGAFLQIVERPNTDFDVPGADYSFARLFAAQSAGDALTLRKHGLPLQRVDAGQDALSAIQALTAATQARATSAADQ